VASSRHRDVIAYRRAADLADLNGAQVPAWSQRDQWTIGVQLLRSSGSIGANIAEALGRGKSANGRRLLFIARGSLLETEHWVDRAAHLHLPVPDDVEERLAELARLLHGLIRSDRFHP